MLNLPSGRANSIISDLSSGISQLRQQVQGLKQDTGSWVNVLGSGTSKLNGPGGGSSNQVAPYPKFSVDAQGVVNYQGSTSGGGALVFQQAALQPYQSPVYGTTPPMGPPPSGPGGRMGDYRNAMATIGVGAMQAMPGTKEGVDYQLALSRMVFYQQQPAFQKEGLFGISSLPGIFGVGKGDQQRAAARQAADALMKAGTATSKFDAVNAYATAAQYGLSGPNMQQMMMGNAAMSNLTPGIGLEGSTRAYGAMQQARNVNMLRGIGIKIRGEDGSMKPMPQIIDELWRKINREKVGGEPLTVDDVRISLQPGNALASMLDQYFGNDPLLRKQVEDGLIFKARTGGAAIRGGKAGRQDAERVGATTAAVSSLAQRTAESTKTLGQVADAVAAGFTEGNRTLSRLSGMFNFLDRWTGVLKLSGAFKGMADTIASGGNFMLTGAGAVFNAFKGLFKAEGGPVEGKTPYIVGERGPELFVPKMDGQIVPNHDLKNYPFRDGSGGRNVTAGGYTSKSGLTEKSSPEAWAKAMLVALGAPTNSDSIDALKTWARFEGGHFLNSAAYNPLNTSLKMPGSGPMSDKNKLVQRYANWDDGIAATVTTLTGKNADSRGYTAIVEALRKGADKDTILAAVNKSAWVHGEGKASNYKFDGASSDYNASKYSGSGGATSSTDGKFSMRDFLESNKQETKSLLASMTKGSWDSAKHVPTATTYNYGGVTVKIDGAQNPSATVEALKAALSSQDTINKAAKF